MNWPKVKAAVPKTSVCVATIPAQEGQHNADKDCQPEAGRILNRIDRNGTGQEGQKIEYQQERSSSVLNSSTAVTSPLLSCAKGVFGQTTCFAPARMIGLSALVPTLVLYDGSLAVHTVGDSR